MSNTEYIAPEGDLTARILHLGKLEPEDMLEELLAVIHGDGGHFADEHGLATAVAVAESMWHERAGSTTPHATTSEREAFEASYARSYGYKPARFGESYTSNHAATTWVGWQARAALSAPPQAEPRDSGWGWQINLTANEAETLRDCIGDDETQAVVLSAGPGHSGWGLYAWSEEYPDEGAVLVTELPAPQPEPAGQQGPVHTGFTDIVGDSRTTASAHETKEYAERIAAGLQSKRGVWRAVEHGFADCAVPQANPVNGVPANVDNAPPQLPVAYLRSTTHPDWLEVCQQDSPGAFAVFAAAPYAVSERSVMEHDFALLLNRLILMAGSKAMQDPDTPADERLTDADVDDLEAQAKALFRAALNGADASPDVSAEAAQELAAILKGENMGTDDLGIYVGRRMERIRGIVERAAADQGGKSA